MCAQVQCFNVRFYRNFLHRIRRTRSTAKKNWNIHKRLLPSIYYILFLVNCVLCRVNLMFYLLPMLYVAQHSEVSCFWCSNVSSIGNAKLWPAKKCSPFRSSFKKRVAKKPYILVECVSNLYVQSMIFLTLLPKLLLSSAVHIGPKMPAKV